MIKYPCKLLDDFIEDIRKSSVTPSADYLFKIRNAVDAMKLREQLAVV